ncbi:MAG: FG-GAP repeat protein [Alphaproteobacteria bacterium]|nr:FG-GAP repeat protein [Alphaproteobacteria bacterium]
MSQDAVAAPITEELPRRGGGRLAALLVLAACHLVPEAELDPDGDGLTWSEDCSPWGSGQRALCEEDSAPPDDSGFEDADGDGHSSDADCDDADARVYPGAPELCDDGVVNDCGAPAGAADARCVATSGQRSLVDAASLTLRGPASGDQLGAAVAGLGDLDGDGRDDVAVGAPGFGGSPDGAALLSRTILGGEPDAEAVDAFIEAERTQDTFGAALAGVPDLDGDGLAELLVGAPTADGEQPDAGAAYLFYGPGPSGTVNANGADAVLLGELSNNEAGWAVAPAGPTQQGLAGIWVTSPQASNASRQTQAGAASLVSGAPQGQVNLANQPVRIEGQHASERLGASVADAGDTDGDGLHDVLVGAAYYNGNQGVDESRAYLFLAPHAGLISSADAEATILAGDSDEGVSQALAGPGDVNGDGYTDLLLGCVGCNRAYLVRGPVSGELNAWEGALTLDGEPDAATGVAVAGAGDFDGDGRPDLLIGAPGYASNAGRAYVVIGDQTGTLDLADAYLVLDAGEPGARMGEAVAGVGDVDGNGAPDLLLGGPAAGEGAGAVWLVLGAP